MKTRTLFLITLLCQAAASAQFVHAATIQVRGGDHGPGTLRQALADANDGDTLELRTHIILGRERALEIRLLSGELLVNKSVTIRGYLGPNGERPIVRRATGEEVPPFRVFRIAPGKTVTLTNLNISEGIAPHGGGIYNDDATLILNNCFIHANRAPQAYGGGIYNVVNRGHERALQIHNSTIKGNSAGFGGGIYCRYNEAAGAELHVFRSTIEANVAQADGGGIYFAGTCAEDNFCETIISNSTLSHNSASSDGGGILGIIGSLEGTSKMYLALYSSTLNGNSARQGGGGSILFFGTRRARCDIWNTILRSNASAGNIRGYGLVSLGHNLCNDNGQGVLIAQGDQINTDPMLGPLQDNGGPTDTHALLRGSPAINRGDPDPGELPPYPAHDQRGVAFRRVVNGRIDIGSFEVQ